MKKKITKKQHYVPCCLLKNFAHGTHQNKKINIFDINKYELRYDQPILKLFSQNYFYDRDNQVEDFIGKCIEAPASIIIDGIVNGHRTINAEEKLTLNRFILSLFFRTPRAIERASKFINSQVKSIVEELMSLNGFDAETASEDYLEIQKDRLVSNLTLDAFLAAIVIGDLEYHIIENETNLDFFISDHPVFMYNWLYRDLDHPSVTSIAANGLQMFLPLSSKLTLCLYDSNIYKYGARRGLETCIHNHNDVEILNSFQVINASSIIAFNSPDSCASVKYLHDKYKSFDVNHYECSIIKTKEEINEENKSIHLNLIRQARLKKMPSFIKIKKKSKGHASYYQERNPGLVERHLESVELLQKENQRSILEV